MLSKLWEKYGAQFVRFFVVGVGATLLHWGVYVALNFMLGLTEEQKFALVCTSTVGYAVSFIANYIISLRWTFRTEGSKEKGIGFAFSHAVNWGLQTLLVLGFSSMGLGSWMANTMQSILPWLVEMLPILGDGANLILLPVFVIVVPINFLLVRFFLTRGDEQS